MVKVQKIDYDEENDILYLSSGEKVKDSLQIENFVIDFSSENKIVAIEILDASKILSRLSQLNIVPASLSKIESAAINIYQGRELMYILLSMRMPVENISVDVRIPVPAPAAVSAR